MYMCIFIIYNYIFISNNSIYEVLKYIYLHPDTSVSNALFILHFGFFFSYSILLKEEIDFCHD